MLTVIVAGRNDDYGKNFRQRLLRTSLHNSALFQTAGIQFEYVLAEWNPLPDRPPLSEEFVDRVPNARSVIIPPQIHRRYTLNPQMPFHEMAAKNAALRRARGDVVIVTNADILFSVELVHKLAAGGWEPDTLYRAHRIDVKPELDWNEIQNPANQLPSGEGTLCPPYYLGAGGDFCLAVRDLWQSLGGFNEQIRFATRAKDWQFFLSASAQDIPIKFAGSVYHLDHDGGFRNTHADDRNSAGAHFGTWWDIEFGLPVSNRADWGFSNLRERPFKNDSRMVELESKDYVIREQEDYRDRELMTWLTRPQDSSDTAAAVFLHAICAAQREKRRLICRVRDARLAVTLSGFESVASRFGVQIYCNWNWPRLPGYTVRPFSPEPRVLRDIDWILEETDCGIHVFENASGCQIDALPQRILVDEPQFNPVLARRLLYAYLGLQEAGTEKIAIYGAGSHTRSLLEWGLPDTIELVGIIETLGTAGTLPRDIAILLSSSAFESDMLEACRERGIHNVVALYGDWPRDLWRIATRV
jgi:hypothetical protein